VFISSYARTIINFRGSLIRDLIDLNAEVYVVAPNYDEDIRKDLKKLGAKPVDYFLDRTGMCFINDIRTIIQLLGILAKIRPRMIIAYNIKPIIYGLLAGAIVRIPYRIALIEGLGFAFVQEDSIRKKFICMFAKFLYKLSLCFASLVFFLNRDDSDEFIRLRLVDPRKVRHICGIGVLLNEWQPQPPMLNPITFTLAARLIKEKGIYDFVKAATMIKIRYPHTRFIILGPLDTSPGAIRKAEIDEWVKSGIIEWPGLVLDIRKYIAKTSVFVLPSYYREGVPRSIQEAMAMGRPIITTDVPGCRETVVNGVNGFLIPPMDAKSLANKMEEFILRPMLICQMGGESRRIAEERFNSRKINSMIIKEIAMIETD